MARHRDGEQKVIESSNTTLHRGRGASGFGRHKESTRKPASGTPRDTTANAFEGRGELHEGHGVNSTTKDRLYMGKGGSQGGGSQLAQSGFPPSMEDFRREHRHNAPFEGAEGDQGRSGREAKPVPARPLKQKPIDGGTYYYPAQKGR